ncbi:MAG: TonB-dependent receptor [Bacteroidia bacterium]|nr:TonB-dependent receptor [Bacteroidia bacterium]
MIQGCHGKLLRTLAILSLIMLYCLPSFGQAEKAVSISVNDLSLSEVLQQISQQTGFNFSYNPDAVDTQQKIDFQVKEKDLGKCLKIIQNKTGISYQIIGRQIILKAPKPEPKKFTFSGYLSDSQSGESLIGAAIGIPGKSIGTFTNEFGFFSLTLEEGDHQLICFHYGYQKRGVSIRLSRNILQKIDLSPLSYDLPTVEIAPPLEDILEKKQLDALEISPNELKKLPEFAGEPGIVNSLQSLTGIKMHSDGSAYFYSRGGSRDQNIIFIDDAPIFNPSHLFGFYSVFVPDFAKSISVYKSNMPANMGDRLSSIVSIRTKDGNLKKGGLSGAVNPFVYRISFETPIKKEKSSLFVTLRRSNFRWLYGRITPDYDASFYDFQIKWNRKLNDKNRLFFTGILGSDFLGSQNRTQAGAIGIDWGTSASTLRWNHVFGPKMFSNTTLHTGSYATRAFLNPTRWNQELGMLSIKSDFTHYTNPGFRSKFGFERQWYFTNPGQLSQDSSLVILPNFKSELSQKTVLYYQGQWDITAKIRLNGGWRALSWANLGPSTYYTFDDQYNLVDTIQAAVGAYHRYFNLDPRLNLRIKLSESSLLNFGFGQYHQYLQFVSNSISPFTTLEQWLPASPNIRPQEARQWSLNYLNYFEENKLEISAAIYHKSLLNQVDFEGNTQTFLNPFLEGDLRFGTTRAYGFEFMIQKAWKRWDGWLSYNYSRVIRQTRDINNNQSYPAFQDRPHDFSAFLHYQSPKNREWSFYWISYSGSPFTSPVGFFQFNEQQVPIYGEKHNDRLPAYHRLDVSYKMKLKANKSGRFQHDLTLSVNNLLAHRNLIAVRFNKVEKIAAPFRVESNVLLDKPLGETQLYLVRFFPSITYRFSI